MKIELIPVLDIYYADQGLSRPESRDAAVWDEYQGVCLQRAGFTDPMVPYLSGTTFYRLVDISDANLRKWLLDHTMGYREGDYERSDARPFSGGYVLKVDGKDKFFPQCCSDLADISFWKGLANGKILPAEGHPIPEILFKGELIIFTFEDEFEEFSPLPPETILKVPSNGLAVALEKVQETLLVFQERIEWINEVENLKIENIHELLIWGG